MCVRKIFIRVSKNDKIGEKDMNWLKTFNQLKDKRVLDVVCMDQHDGVHVF